MIKQVFDVDGFWKVIVYWDIDFNFFDDVELELRMIGFLDENIKRVRKALESKEAKAVTCSHQHTSIVIFNKHSILSDYVSSIVHEAEHVKQSILKAYRVEDIGEAPAYTIGYIVKNMWKVFRMFCKT